MKQHNTKIIETTILKKNDFNDPEKSEWSCKNKVLTKEVNGTEIVYGHIFTGSGGNNETS